MKIANLAVRDKLLEKGLRVFGLKELGVIFSQTERMTKYYVEKFEKEGLFLRLKPGLYCLKTDLLSEQEIANQVYQPSYISFEYALAFYNILPEMVYVVTSATTKASRKFEVLGKGYEYTTIRKDLYWGCTPKAEGNSRFVMAEPEKALTDYLYLVSLGGKVMNERLEVISLDKDKIFGYAEKYARPAMMKLAYALY